MAAARPPAAMNVIGQLSPDTVQFSALRNNRLVTAMQEEAATKRTALQEQGAKQRAALAERGASSRAALETGGANQRAALQAKTALAGQQAEAQLTREQMAQSDQQQAAEIRARRESDEFNAALQREMRKSDQDFESARFEKEKALAAQDLHRYEQWAKKEQDLNTVRTLLDYSLGAMNLRMTMGMAEKLAGAERANEGLLTARRQMERSFAGKTMAFEAIDKQIDRRLADPQAMLKPVLAGTERGAPALDEQVDALFQPLTTALQVPVSLDLFEPRNRDKLEQAASTWDVAQAYAILQSLTKMRDKLAGLKGDVEKRAEGVVGKLKYGPPASMLGVIDAGVKRLDDALTTLDTDLPRSSRALPDSSLTLGQQWTGYRMAHRGLTEEALTALGAQLYPEDNPGLAGALEGLYRQPLTPENPLLPEKLRAGMSPEALALFNSIWESLGGAVPGLRPPQNQPFDIANPKSRLALIEASLAESRARRGGTP